MRNEKGAGLPPLEARRPAISATLRAVRTRLRWRSARRRARAERVVEGVVVTAEVVRGRSGPGKKWRPKRRKPKPAPRRSRAAEVAARRSRRGRRSRGAARSAWRVSDGTGAGERGRPEPDHRGGRGGRDERACRRELHHAVPFWRNCVKDPCGNPDRAGQAANALNRNHPVGPCGNRNTTQRDTQPADGPGSQPSHEVRGRYR